MTNSGTKWMCVRAKDGAVLRKSGKWCWVGPVEEIKLYGSSRAASRYGLSRIKEEDYADDFGGLREVGSVVPVEPGQRITMNGYVGSKPAEVVDRGLAHGPSANPHYRKGSTNE